MKPRVLQLIGSFHNGGSERQAVALTRLLREEGSYEVLVAVLRNEGPLRAELERTGIDQVAEFPITSFFRPSFVKHTKAFAGYLRENQIDIIQAHDFYTNVFGMAAAASAGTFARIAAKRETDGLRSKNQDRVERLAFGTATKIVVNSRAVLEHLTARGIKETRIEIIHNGVDLAPFGPEASLRGNELRVRYGIPENAHLITLVANLRHEVKNIPMFIRTAQRVSAEVDNVHYVIAGEGELSHGLQRGTRELAISDHVHFIGRCEDIPALLSTSSACVLTSTAEGFSNAILEYMSAGKAVVATNVGGASEAIVEGETGYLVKSDDDSTMAVKLIELLEQPELAERLGAAGRERIGSEFSARHQLDRMLDLYGRLLQS